MGFCDSLGSGETGEMRQIWTVTSPELSPGSDGRVGV